MALIHSKVRLPSSIYEDNYGYTINYYQPMIDYLDRKNKYHQQNCSKLQNINYNHRPPHLPWTNERGLKQYRPSNLVRPYTTNDINTISKSVAAIANENLINRCVNIRSPFSVIKIADASRILKHLPKDTVIERQFEREREHKLREIEFNERERKGLIRLKNIMDSNKEIEISSDLKRAIRGKSANAITAALLAESDRNIRTAKIEEDQFVAETRASHELFKRGLSENRLLHTRHIEIIDDRLIDNLDHRVSSSLVNVKRQLTNLNTKNVEFYAESSKATAIEIEQLNARVVEAETRLKTEVARIKKKLQIQITELEMSLDIANKTNIDLQKIIKKQSLQLTELQAHYDEIQRQLQQTLDQYTVAQRRLQAMNGELEEVRLNLDTTQRAKRQIELQCEECHTRINELTVVNVNLASSKNKIEQELAIVASDYEEITKELRISDERYQKVQIDLKHTIETLHDEQERIVKIETIKKSLEVEVKNLSIRLEEVEANAVAGAKRIITKLEARIRDLELELEEEKRRHAETIKILRKKERTVKEVMIQCEEDQKNINLLQEALECANSKVHLYKRQLAEQEGMSAQSVTRVRRFQRELEAAEERAECAESNLNMIRAKHRTFVTTSTTTPNSVYLVQETRTITE